LETLRRGELITEDEVWHLCNIGREILAEDGNIQRVDAPVTVCKEIFVYQRLNILNILDLWRYSRAILGFEGDVYDCR